MSMVHAPQLCHDERVSELGLASPKARHAPNAAHRLAQAPLLLHIGEDALIFNLEGARPLREVFDPRADLTIELALDVHMRAEDLGDLRPQRHIVRVDLLNIFAVKEHIEELLKDIRQRLIAWREAPLLGDLLAHAVRHRIAEAFASDAIFGFLMDRTILAQKLFEHRLKIELRLLAIDDLKLAGRDKRV